MNSGEVWGRVDAAVDRCLAWLAEQQLIELLITEIFWQWPTQIGGLCLFQVLVNGALDDGTGFGDLALCQSQCRQS